MDADAARKEKRKVESKIMELLIDFETKSGLHVYSVNIDTLRRESGFPGSDVSTIFDIKIDVRLF